MNTQHERVLARLSPTFSNQLIAFKPHRTAFVLCAALLFICLLWEVGNGLWGWDMAVSGQWGSAHGFALQNDPLWGVLLYKTERLIGWGAMAALVVATLRPAWLPTGLQKPPRSDWVWMCVGVIASLLVIQALKRNSLTSCPWSLSVFGSVANQVWHGHFGISDGGPGRCFPAGHPSGAFAFLGVPVLLSRCAPKGSAFLLMIILLAGLFLGATQVMRGAHFVSHVLWTAWWCSAVACCTAWLHWRWETRRRQAP